MKAKNVAMTLGLGALGLGAAAMAGSRMKNMNSTQIKDKVVKAAEKMMQ